MVFCPRVYHYQNGFFWWGYSILFNINAYRTTPKDKIENMISYIKGKKPSSLKPIFIQEDLNLDRSQTDFLKKILDQISDCDLLSVTLQAVLLLQNQNKDEISRLVLSGDFQHKDADYTHQTIHQLSPDQKRIALVPPLRRARHMPFAEHARPGPAK